MDDETAAKALSFKLNTYNPFASSQAITYVEKLAYRNEFFLLLLEEGVSLISVGANTFVLDMTALALEIFSYMPEQPRRKT